MDTFSGHDAIRSPDAVGADNLFPLAVPGEQVQIPLVKGIEIKQAACPFADGPVGDFTKPPDFAERGGYPTRLRQKHLERATLDETGLVWQLLDFCTRWCSPHSRRTWRAALRWCARLKGTAVPELLDGSTDRRSRLGSVTRSANKIAGG